MSEIMKFENVSKTFQDGDEQIEALSSTSFTVNAGELVAIVGPSGSGKSTLLTIMGGLQEPDEGDIYFDGKKINDMSPDERSQLRFKEIGFILQASNLVPFLTISEQFQLVDKLSGEEYDEEKAKELMDKVGIKGRKDQYPGDLSGGERQRAAICRALYPNPKLLLADEPTASLDTERAMEVVKLLKDLTEKAERTTVMVTHDTRLLKYCDRVFEIIDGKMEEEDPADFQDADAEEEKEQK